MTNSEKIKILFFGELPPNVVHGVSISNKINTDILAEIGELSIVEEKWDLRYHDQFSIRKIFLTLKSVFEIWRVSFSKSPDLFYSVLYVSVFGSMKNVISLLAVKLGSPKAKILLHVHRSDLKNILTQKLMFRTIVRFFKWCGVHFIVLSELQKMEVDRYLDRAEVLYNAIDEDEIYPIQQSDSNSVIRLLYISNYICEKGILDLLKAFKGLNATKNKLQLDCYGGFTDEKTKEEIEHLTIGFDRININAAVYGEEKNRVLNRADIVVLPSYNEGLPLVLLETLRLAKPIVITEVGYVSEVLGSDYPLYCKAGDLKSIQAGILAAIEIYNKSEFPNKLTEIYKRFNYFQHEKRFRRIVHETLSFS